MPEIITRAEAKARGLKRYFTGKPCARGHICERYVNCSTCVGCRLDQATVWRRQNPKKRKEIVKKSRLKCRAKALETRRRWAAKNRRKLADQALQWRIKNPEKVRLMRLKKDPAAQRASREKFKQRMKKVVDLLAVLRTEMPDLLKEFGL